MCHYLIGPTVFFWKAFSTWASMSVTNDSSGLTVRRYCLSISENSLHSSWSKNTTCSINVFYKISQRSWKMQKTVEKCDKSIFTVNRSSALLIICIKASRITSQHSWKVGENLISEFCTCSLTSKIWEWTNISTSKSPLKSFPSWEKKKKKKKK